MVSCLILHNHTITSLTKCKVLRAILHEEVIEKSVRENDTVIVYIKGIDKVKVWQTVMDLEMSDISVGYGFGDNKKDAKANAEARLKLIISMEISS